MCQESLNSPCQKIKATASLVGCLIAALPGVQLPGQKILVHPLHTKLALLAAHISGKQLDSTSYRKGLCKFSAMHGGEVPDPSMTLHLEVGNNFVLEGRWIPIIPL